MVLLTQAAPVKLASPGLTGLGLSRELASFYSAHLAQHELKVVTNTEMAQLLGLERQKQLLGCASDASSCMAELANALGVDGIITGSIGKLDEVFQINVKVVGAGNARQLAVFSAKV